MSSINEELIKKYGKQFEIFLKNSNSNTFRFKNGCIENEEKDILLFLRKQQGWDKVWQKIFVTDDMGMSIGISIVEPGGGGECEEVKSEFIDFVLAGEGVLTVEGVGSYEIKEGDFLNIKKGIKRGFRNTGSSLFISVFGIGTSPSYDENRSEDNE